MTEDDVHIVEGMPPMQPIPNISVGKLIYENLIANCSENEALVDALTGESISYKTVLSTTCSLAESLRRSGCNESTMTAICSENCIEFFLPIIATLYIGAPIAPINHNYTQSETLHALNIAKPKIIFCSQQVYPKIMALKKELTFIKKVLIIDAKNENSVQEFIDECLHRSGPLYKFDLTRVNPDDVAFILYSSGTTGLAKGVMITQKNVLVKFLHSNDPRLAKQDTDTITFGFLPFFHAYGLFIGLGAIYKSIKIIVMKRFEEKIFLATIEKYRVTTLPLVPPLAVLLSKSPLVEQYDLSSVKYLFCGAAPLSKNVEDSVKKRLKVDSLRQGYGLTECTLGVAAMPVNENRLGSSGKVLPNIWCKLRDPNTGKSLGPNQVGEICVKGDVVMKGYYGDKEATKNSFTKDGWLLTGDLGYYDEDKFFYIVGRLKELIKYKGFQVAPAELEAILLTHPQIKDAAVIGAPDEEAGELPMAFVVVHPNSKLTATEVEDFVAKRVSPHKRLRGGVEFISEIPKNPSGKILRRKLHELLMKYVKLKL